MIKYLFFIIILFLSILFSRFYPNFILAISILILFFIFLNKIFIFLSSFLAGILIDSFSFSFLGERSIYFLLILFLIFLYQNKFEIKNFWFITISCFIGAFFYNLIFYAKFYFLFDFLIAFLSGFIFLILNRIIKSDEI